MSEQGNNNWRLCTNLHCSPLRNCIRQKMNGQWHPFVCPLIFIGTLMSRAIKLNSGLKCFSSPQIEVERRTWAIKVSVFRLHFSSAITSISHHILSVRPPVHPSVDPSGSQSVSQPVNHSNRFRLRFVFDSNQFVWHFWLPVFPLSTSIFFRLQTLFVCFYRLVLRIRNKKFQRCLLHF